MIPADLHYLWPQGVYLLLCVGVFLFCFWLLFLYRQRVSRVLSTPSLLKSLLIPRASSIYWIKVGAGCLSWTLITLAVMQPQGNGHYLTKKSASKGDTPLRRKAHEVILFIDTSASMEIKDGRSGQSRLNYAKEIADEVVSRLTGEIVSLYAFTSEVTKMVPATHDYLFTRLVLNQMHLNEGEVSGTSLEEVLKYLQSPDFSTKKSLQKSVLIFSDGGDTSIEGLLGEEKKRSTEALYQLIPDPQLFQLRLFTIGLGIQKGAPVPHVEFEGKPVFSALDKNLLSELATKGNGYFYEADQLSVVELAQDLVNRLEQEESNVIDDQTDGETLSPNYDLYFQLPLGLALFLLSFYLFFPEGWSTSKNLILLFVFIAPFFTEATFQQASLYYDVGEYRKAQEIYEDLVKKQLSSWEKQIITYNLATTLLTQGENQKALTLFHTIQDQNPLIQKGVKYHLALAQRALAQTLSDQRARRYLLKDALRNIRLAQGFSCQLQKLQGYSSCQTSKTLTALEGQLEKELAELPALPLEENKEEEEVSPQGILKSLIDRQQDLLEKNLDRLIQDKITEPDQIQLIEQLREKQEKNLQLSTFFYPSVSQLQQVLFIKEGCQCEPWNQVLPLFEKGTQAAFMAKKWLKDDPEQAQEKIYEALMLWHEALNQLNAPKKNQRSPPSPSQETSREKSPEREKKLSLDKVKSFLQEMEFDDQMPNKDPERLKHVLKPW